MQFSSLCGHNWHVTAILCKIIKSTILNYFALTRGILHDHSPRKLPFLKKKKNGFANKQNKKGSKWQCFGFFSHWTPRNAEWRWQMMQLMKQCRILQWNEMFLIQATVRRASLCIWSVLPWQHRLTDPCQKQVFDICLRVEGVCCFYPCNTHKVNSWNSLGTKNPKCLDLKKLTEICGYQQRWLLNSSISCLPDHPVSFS